MKLEFLIIVDSEGAFCRDINSFKNFLQADAEIKFLNNKKLTHRGYEVTYELLQGNNAEKNHRFYHIRLKCSQEKVEELAALGRALKKILSLASKNNVQTLWDDVSFYYSRESYPYIYEIENLMRKLITKFMLTNVGLGWAKDTIPEEVRKTARADAGELNNNYLYEVDFIQLSNFLFNAYRTLDLTALVKKLSEVDGEFVAVSEISDFIPASNWKRYFQPHVDCDGPYLQTRWERLYKLRCKIAHNNTFSASDYEQTKVLSREVKEKLEKAIDSLDGIAVPEEEREELAERAASQSSQFLAEFIQKWRMVEHLTEKILINGDFLVGSAHYKKKSLFGQHTELARNGILNQLEYRQLRILLAVRNSLVHDHSNSFTSAEIAGYSMQIDDLVERLTEILNKFAISGDDKGLGSSDSAPAME